MSSSEVSSEVESMENDDAVVESIASDRAIVESAAYDSCGSPVSESVNEYGGSDGEHIHSSQPAEVESGGCSRSTAPESDGESAYCERPIETCAGDGECSPCVDGDDVECVPCVDGDGSDDGADEPVDGWTGDGADEAYDAGEVDGAGSQVPRVLPTPASVRALQVALAGGEWDGVFSSYRGCRAAVERNWKRLRGGVPPKVVNRPVSEEVLSQALANARDMQSGRLVTPTLAAAEAETDGVDAYAEYLRGRAAEDIASKGLDDGSTVPSLSMAVPKLTEADKRSIDWSVRDGQLSDPRCKTQDGMAAAIQYGMDATGGLCTYCDERVAWRVVVDRATGEMGWRCASKPASGDECQHDHVFSASLGGFVMDGNLLPACADCNARKSNMSVWDFIYVVVNDHALDGKRRFDDAASFAVFILEASLPFLALLSEREWETLVMGVRPVSRVETWLEQQAMMGMDPASLVDNDQLAKLDATEKTYADPVDVSRGDFDVICTMMRAGEFSSSAYGRDGELSPSAAHSNASSTASTMPVSEFCSLLPDVDAGRGVASDLTWRVASAAARGAIQYSGKWDGSKWTLLGNVVKRYVSLFVKYHVNGLGSGAGAAGDGSCGGSRSACSAATAGVGDDGSSFAANKTLSSALAVHRVLFQSCSRLEVFEAMSAIGSIVGKPGSSSAVGGSSSASSFDCRDDRLLSTLIVMLKDLQRIDSLCREKDERYKPSRKTILEGLRRLAVECGLDSLACGPVDCWKLSETLCSTLEDNGSISLGHGDWVAARKNGSVKSNAASNAGKKADCMAYGFGWWLGSRLRVAVSQGEKHVPQGEETPVPSATDWPPVDALRGYVKAQLVLGDSPLRSEYIAINGGSSALGCVITTGKTAWLVKGNLLSLLELEACRRHGGVEWLDSAYRMLGDPSTPRPVVREIQREIISIMDDAIAASNLIDPLTGRKWSADGSMDPAIRSKLYNMNGDFKKKARALLNVPVDSPIRFLVEHVRELAHDEASAVVSARVQEKAFEDRTLPDGVTVSEAMSAWVDDGIDLRGSWVSDKTEARHAVRGARLGQGVAAYDEMRGALADPNVRNTYCSSDTLAKMVVDASDLMGVELSSIDVDASEETISDFVDTVYGPCAGKTASAAVKGLEWLFSWMSSEGGFKHATSEAMSHGKSRKLDDALYSRELDAESRLKIKKLDALAGDALTEKNSTKTIKPLLDLLHERLVHKANCGQRGPVAFALEDFVDLASACLHGNGKKDKEKCVARKDYGMLVSVVELAGGEVGLLSVDCVTPSFDEAISMAD